MLLGIFLFIVGTLIAIQNTKSRIGWPLIVAGLILIAVPARAQHPEHDVEIHKQFYNSWMMPKDRTRSCCHERDCYPTEARKIGGRWEAKRREDGQWLVVPDDTIELDRDNPDGRNHLCAPPPEYGTIPYCFIIGGGT
jgi:hypothetical protein